MSRPTGISLAANGLLVAGALVPLAASGFTGMALGERPGVVVVGLLCWAVGLVLAYRAFAADGRQGMSTTLRLCGFVTASSATVLVLGMAFGFVYHPTIGTSFFGTNFTTVLMVTLAVMGVQITVADWKGALGDARAVSALVLVRWIVMPLTGYCVGFLTFRLLLPPDIADPLAIGLMLLCTSPPGAASNSLTLLSRGDLALSVSATAVNVLIAPFLQPLLIQLYIGSAASVDTQGIFLDLLGFVLAPVVVASVFGALFPGVVATIRPFLGPIAVISLACVLMGTLAKGAATIIDNLAVLPLVLVACVIQGLLGLTLGYQLPRLLKLNRRQRVASSFEVGVENAAIAPALAAAYFSPLAIVPGVVYGKTQNLLAVTIFVRKFRRDADREDALEQGRLRPAEQLEREG